MKVLVALCSIVVLAGCSSGSSGSGGGGNSPTSPISNALVVEAFSTATQNEPGGFRLQLRLRVLQGLAALQDATNRGAASARTCLAGTCSEDVLSVNFMEAACPAMAEGGQAEVSIGSAWLNGNVIGIDVCVSDMSDGLLLETSVEDDFNRSNTIRTSCAAGGGQVICGSD